MPPPPRDPGDFGATHSAAPQGDDDLTAYLDGELDGAAARAVEAKLANDLDARRQAEGLKKAFDLLDYLPVPEPSADFATRTMTRLQPAVVAPGTPAPSSPVSPVPVTTSGSAATTAFGTADFATRPTLKWALWAVAGVVAFGVGYAGHRLAPSSADRTAKEPEDLAKDSRVLAHLPLYLGVDDLDFVKALVASDLFEPEMVAPPSAKPEGSDAGSIPSDKLIDLFRSYPVARRQQLRKLDQDLHELPAADQDRLRPILENYALWLDRLPDGDRRDILAAPTPVARLDAVTQLYQKRWRESLPVPIRDKLAIVAGVEERFDLLNAWKVADKARRDEWHVARRQWPTLFGSEGRAPWPFAEPGMADQVDQYVKTAFKVDLAVAISPKNDMPLAARLTRPEFNALKSARDSATKDKNWFVYGVAVYRLAQLHPYLPEPQPGKPLVVSVVTLPADLPPRLLRQIPKGGDGATRGKWPEFALEAARKFQLEKVPVPESFGPCRPADFTEPVRNFLTTVLVPRLTDAEREALKKLEGKWPEYPQQVLKLAALPKYDFAVPTVTLPGAPSLWAKYYGVTPPKE